MKYLNYDGTLGQHLANKGSSFGSATINALTPYIISKSIIMKALTIDYLMNRPGLSFVESDKKVIQLPMDSLGKEVAINVGKVYVSKYDRTSYKITLSSDAMKYHNTPITLRDLNLLFNELEQTNERTSFSSPLFAHNNYMAKLVHDRINLLKQTLKPIDTALLMPELKSLAIDVSKQGSKSLFDQFGEICKQLIKALGEGDGEGALFDLKLANDKAYKEMPHSPYHEAMSKLVNAVEKTLELTCQPKGS